MSDASRPPNGLREHDALDDFERRELTFLGETTVVHVAGTGPAVIVMTEIPGITPEVARFARMVRDAGFTVYLPSLFGVDGKPASREYAYESLQAPCVRREFEAFRQDRPSPMARWLRQLAAHAHGECDGPGVGAIGMCLTGNFALTMMLEPAMLAPVMAQPSMPLDEDGGTFLQPDEMSAVKRRLDDEDLTVLAYRFEGDRKCQAARFDAFRETLGDRLITRVLPDESAAGGWTGFPHGVVTTDLIDEAGEPTADARDEIVQFFRDRLRH